MYRRPGFNCIVKQLRFWLSKVDCDLRVLRIGHTCVIYTNNCELREKSKFAIIKLRNWNPVYGIWQQSMVTVLSLKYNVNWNWLLYVTTIYTYILHCCEVSKVYNIAIVGHTPVCLSTTTFVLYIAVICQDYFCDTGRRYSRQSVILKIHFGMVDLQAHVASSTTQPPCMCSTVL